MKLKIQSPKILRLKDEILLLRQHLHCVTILGLRRQIEQQIEQKQISINLIIQRGLAKYPKAPQKILDKEGRRVLK
jgi:hypothetical protein